MGRFPKGMNEHILHIGFHDTVHVTHQRESRTKKAARSHCSELAYGGDRTVGFRMRPAKLQCCVLQASDGRIYSFLRRATVVRQVLGVSRFK